MTAKTKILLRTIIRELGLRIKYVSDLPDKVCGFLDPSRDSRTIVINARKSKSEHAFTIVHEAGHFILHVKRSHRIKLPWFLKHRWKTPRIARCFGIYKRTVFEVLTEEYQADMWAFCALFQIEATDDVQAILEQHSEKTGVFWLSVLGTVWNGIKARFNKILWRRPKDS